jgi:hypothetical protein
MFYYTVWTRRMESNELLSLRHQLLVRHRRDVIEDEVVACPLVGVEAIVNWSECSHGPCLEMKRYLLLHSAVQSFVAVAASMPKGCEVT